MLVGALWSIPLIKSLNKEFPPPVPGADGPPVMFSLPDEFGRQVSLVDLRGNLAVISELPLADAKAREEAFLAMRELRKDLRGLSFAVNFVVLCHGGTAEDLSRFLDAKRARKPVNVYLLDEGRRELELIRQQAGSRAATFILLDTQSRIRGVYGGDQEGIDRLKTDTGHLANRRDMDPPLDDAPQAASNPISAPQTGDDGEPR